MADVIAVLILVVLIGGAAAYLIRAKRNGVKCVGCPAGGNCSDRRKRKEKNCQGPSLRRKLSLFQECTVNIACKV